MVESVKRCSTCHEIKPLSDYNVRRAAPDGRQARCRACARAWYLANNRDHVANVRRRNDRVRRANQARLGDYFLEHPCVDCGETDPRVLEFDHEGVVPKRYNVSGLVGASMSWEQIEREIAACSVRCANCHRRITCERAANWRQRFFDERGADTTTEASARLQRLLG